MRNPYPRYEISLEKTPSWLALAVVLLAAACILGTIYLSVTAPEPVIPPSAYRIAKPPAVPNISAQIQQHVNDALTGNKAVR